MGGQIVLLQILFLFTSRKSSHALMVLYLYHRKALRLIITNHSALLATTKLISTGAAYRTWWFGLVFYLRQKSTTLHTTASVPETIPLH